MGLKIHFPSGTKKWLLLNMFSFSYSLVLHFIRYCSSSILIVSLFSVGQKLRLRLECDRELDELRRKYDALIQDAEIKFADSRPRLDVIYEKIQMHQKLADGLHEILNEIIEGVANAYKGMNPLPEFHSFYLV